MLLSVHIDDIDYRVELDAPLDISIPLNFNGAQPNAYGVEEARSAACEAGSIVGDTRRGGSCNFEQITMIPHCNGTHTECAGHITDERIFVRDCLREAFVSAALVSVEPEQAGHTRETYAVEMGDADLLITEKALKNALEKLKSEGLALRNPEALIVRTLPNEEAKLTREYLAEIPPFFSTEAMRLMREAGILHLLVDLPSIDRIYDEGKLSNHRIFWNVRPGSRTAESDTLIGQTITELIYVPDEIADGCYLLNLQIAPFAADASPSRPLLFKFK